MKREKKVKKEKKEKKHRKGKGGRGVVVVGGGGHLQVHRTTQKHEGHDQALAPKSQFRGTDLKQQQHGTAPATQQKRQ